MVLPGRSFNQGDYRYGMNGQEKDDEIFQGAMTAEYWEYDSRLVKRWNVDPIDYPWQSPYACFNNNPILYSDPEGLEGQDYVKDKKTGAVWYDDKIKDQGGVDSEYNKGSPAGQFEYAGKEVKGAYDTNGNMFDGDANGVKSYYGKEVTVTADYVGQVKANKLSQQFRDQQMDRIKFEVYTGPRLLATGAIYQSISPFDFWSPANFLKATPKVVNLGGRLGNLATRTQIDEIATTLESRGYEITGGGGRLPEEYLPGINGGRKGSSFIDITAKKDNMLIRINTVDIYKSGNATKRELINAARIRAQIGDGQHLLLIPKK